MPWALQKAEGVPHLTLIFHSLREDKIEGLNRAASFNFIHILNILMYFKYMYISYVCYVAVICDSIL